ncbi:DUF3139 domain-containing protein [Alteribacter populi]|uniref:DUF3139 domain-containing protein n=1 Tax=Alteribacter populi TaxID=2011011 RepID=UPI000BBB1699|nr:DUF3139 domain-containing protein [Alteribacter populi]
MAKKPSAKFTVFLVILFLLLPIVIIYVSNQGNPFINNKVEQAVVSHLKDRGFSDSDIKDLQVVRSGTDNIDGAYRSRMKVVFNDEPNVEYTFIKLDGGVVMQLCKVKTQGENNTVEPSSIEHQHLNEDCYMPKEEISNSQYKMPVG